MLAICPPRVVMLLCLVALLAGGSSRSASGEQDVAAVAERLSRGIQFLASDSLEGRGLGSAGIDRAAEYIHQEMAQAGLATDTIDGGPFQPFVYTPSAKLGSVNWAKLHRAEDVRELRLNEHYTPLAVGGAGKIDVPLVFAGYGITAPELDYDDYQGLEIAGKGVIVVRHEPQQGDADSRFAGTNETAHASFRSKIRNAIDHGATAILFCTSKHETDRQSKDIVRRIASAERQLEELDAATEEGGGEEEGTSRANRRRRLTARLAQLEQQRIDAERGLLKFAEGGISSDGTRIPVFVCSRQLIDSIMSDASNVSLADWEARVDQTGEPHSFGCETCRIEAEVAIDREEVPVKNVVGVVEGSGPLAHETVVVGAHYDHLGLGNSARGEGQIHNGADDNASGTMVLLELARRFGLRGEAPARRLVFVAFSAEEKGLLGSSHYVDNPPFPLESTVAMVNFDMVGRMKNNELFLNGVGTAGPFSSWLAQDNERSGFSLTEIPGGKGPSDHASFCRKSIPVVHFFTGLHAEYHRPSDDFELLNVDAMCRLCDLSEAFIDRLLQHPERLPFIDAEGPSMPPREREPRKPRVWFGIRVDSEHEGSGFAIAEVMAGSPAEQGGVRQGDVVIRAGGREMADLDSFQRFLAEKSVGDRIEVVVRRDGEEQHLGVQLEAPQP